ncbi:MAG: 4Fe-4S binding protein [Syntrophomonadaceae bacterium]|nr:4Fe-4S binding protein [Syntrophomonadaceae bacterium]
MLGRLWNFLSNEKDQGEKEVNLYNHLCLNIRSNKQVCQACSEVCPVNGISLEGNRIKVGDCINCGLCAVACPSGVFDDLWNAFYKIVKVVKDPRSNLWVSCHRAPLIKGGLQVNCLGELTTELVFYMLQKGIGNVNVLYQPWLCEDCVCNSGQKIWEQTLNNLSILYPAGTGFNVYADFSPSDLDKIEEVDFTRRGLLRSLALDTGQMLSEFILERSDVNPRPFDQSVSLRRKAVVYMLRNMDPKMVELIGPGHLRHPEINENCTFCGSCTTLCPSGAIKAVSNSNNMVLLVNPAECNMCGLCSVICPAQAIKADNLLNNPDSSLEVVLIQGTKYFCEKCNTTYYCVQENSPCPNCKNSKFKPDMLWAEFY